MKVYYYKGQFTDPIGKVHHFVIAGVLRRCHKSSYVETYDQETWSNGIEYGDKELERYLSIGISIQNPEDNYDERIGELQAEGRALKPRKSEQIREIYVTKFGMLNESLVFAILQNIGDAIVSNPESFIPGYFKMCERWTKGKEQSSSAS